MAHLNDNTKQAFFRNFLVEQSNGYFSRAMRYASKIGYTGEDASGEFLRHLRRWARNYDDLTKMIGGK